MQSQGIFALFISEDDRVGSRDDVTKQSIFWGKMVKS